MKLICISVSPEPVENCTVINKSSETFHLQCVPGFDGGMNQTFHILVKDRITNSVKYDNASLDRPEVLIEHLEAGIAYSVTVIAINKKGASTAVYKTVETLQQPELQLVEEKIELEPDISQSDLILGVSAGVGLCVTLLLIVGFWVRHSRCGRTRQPSLIQEYRQNTGGVGGSVDFHSQDQECMQSVQRKSILKKQHSCDTSPDLIPHQDQGKKPFFLNFISTITFFIIHQHFVSFIVYLYEIFTIT